MGFNYAYCMDNKNFSIGGYWEEPDVQYLHTYLERCNNLTSLVPCKTDEEIDAFFNRKFYGIHLPNTFFDLKDYESPLKHTWRTVIDVNVMKRTKIFLKKVEFTDDKSYLLEDNSLRETFTLDFLEMDFESKNRTAIISEIFFYSSSAIQKKVRKYQKASQFFCSAWRTG